MKIHQPVVFAPYFWGHRGQHRWGHHPKSKHPKQYLPVTGPHCYPDEFNPSSKVGCRRTLRRKQKQWVRKELEESAA